MSVIRFRRHCVKNWAGTALGVLLLALAGPGTLRAASPPAALVDALSDFRTGGPRGWSYLQRTEADDGSLLERYDASQPEARRWTLLERDGRAPTAREIQTYREGQSRRTADLGPPRLQDQFDLTAGEPVAAPEGRIAWRFPLKPGGTDDWTAESLAVTVVLHEATGTIEEVEIASRAPFSPSFAVRIEETRTRMRYSLPKDGQPSLLQEVTLQLRGTAFWLKSLDQDMIVTYSDYQPPGSRAP